MVIQDDAPFDFQTAKAVTRRHILEHAWGPRNVHEKFLERVRPPPLRDKEKGLNRRERRVLAHIQSNAKCPLLKSYLHAIGAAPDDTCDACVHSPDDLAHMMTSCVVGNQHRGLLSDDPTGDQQPPP
ncbi:LOW QUALITY PROTEIN: hypothetical protein ElyMa_005353900 [Elysia marginata]|uniref:Reverse transcriptase zinc-binding domain-containing protein n=1 Tax=Elysia marginata TaxID=1093978 RepID=A0AAV4EAX9_9GAST|nr:LOW QUALITY PROTEIN: hypothetical protein ElyMa_005353900 [Elysia marginata]